MKNVLIPGIAAALLAVGYIGVADAANPNVPSWSPYAIGDSPAPDGYAHRPSQRERPRSSRMIEGRAAYVEGDREIAPSRRRPLSRGGDVIVHTGRSYLDPGTSAAVGTEDRYFYDTAHFDLHSEGPDFTRDTAGFELLR